MAALPNLSDETLREAFSRGAPHSLRDAHLTRLVAHYKELVRWSPRTALIGPGTEGEALERHYAESLAGLAFLPENRPLHLLDIGSGAGFPGFILAAASDDVHVTFVEPRIRKRTFLKTAARRASLPCSVPDARVELPWPPSLPDRYDVVSSRALRLDETLWRELGDRLTTNGRLLLWVGRETPDLPEDWTLARNLHLSDSDHRRVLDLRPGRAR